MTKVNSRGSAVSVFVVALIAGITGFFLGDDSKDIKKLESEISRLRTDLAKSQQLYENELKKRTSSHHANTDFPLPKTAKVPSAEQVFDQRLETERRNHSNFVARVQAETDGEYNLIFSRLGASPELTERFKSNFVVIHRKAIAAGEPLAELMTARNTLQKELRDALGDENYRAFKSYEESKPAIKEFEQLTKFAESEKGMSLDPALSEKIISMIRDSGAATTVTWHGPFDPLPRPAVGQEMVTNRIAQDLSLLRHQSYSLVQSVRESDVPQEYQDLIAEYYRKKIHDKEAELVKFSKPLEERRQEALDAFRKEMEARKAIQKLQQPRSVSKPSPE